MQVGVVGRAVEAKRHLFFSPSTARATPTLTARHHKTKNKKMSGLYYPSSSLKARFCVAGSAALYAYCAAKGVAHARTGKLVVAVSEGELPALAALEQNARAAGVTGLERLGPSDARALEPALTPGLAGALLSTNTGILDSHGLMTALLADVEAAGGVWAPRTAVVGGRVVEEKGKGGARLDVSSPSQPATITARTVVIAAGLGTHRLLARLAGLDAAALPPPLRAAKGSYFRLAGGTQGSAARPPFSRLIYPLPPAGGGGLGVHLTLDLAGQARFGPDVEWMELSGGAEGESDSDLLLGPPGTADPAPSPAAAGAFAAAIRAWWPGLPPGAALVPDYAGVRPKVAGPGEPPGDFVVTTAAPGVVALAGIESPGLTAALLLGEAAAASACGEEGWRARSGAGGLEVGV
jgi:L-2-hydroxyglutarate oxidase LhgO